MKTSTWLVLLALPAMNSAAAEFTVPQGGAKLPTIAIVSCFADEHSRAEGAYCRTTYECSPRDGATVSGTLWEGLRYHNSRRVTLETDAFAHQRSCVLDIEDAAQVQFFTGYRPAGFNGDVVAMVRSGTATVSVTVNTMETPSPNMLEQFLFAVQVATLQDWINYTNTYRDGFSPCRRHGCREAGALLTTVPATERTRCYVEQEVARASEYVGQLLGSLARSWTSQESAGITFSGDNDCNVLHDD